MNNLWIFLALIAMIVSSLHTIIFKYIENNNNYIDISLAIIFLFTGLFSLIYLLYNYNNFKKFLKQKNCNNFLLLSLCVSILILIFNISLLYSVKKSPKISYCLLIINTNIILTLLLAYLLFKEKVIYKAFVGIILAIIGLNITIYYSNN